jgi:DNA (cytosine-5)-methyltransferase 1
MGSVLGMKPRLLDLFCCAGGAGTGYARAGFDVVGVDIDPQPRYPFEFHQGDALEYLAEHGHEFDAIHASPPCQAYSTTRHTHKVRHPEMIEPTRAALIRSGKPFVIENVEGARLQLVDPMLLCGSMFGLTATDTSGERLALRRHRLFESNVWLMSAGGCIHDNTMVGGVYEGGPMQRNRSDTRGGYTPHWTVQAELMGIDWMRRKELAQAIPPAMTEFIGHQLVTHLRRKEGGNDGERRQTLRPL